MKKKEIFLVYKAGYADGYVEYRFLPATDAGGGGVEAFEAELRKAATWYSRLGRCGLIETVAAVFN